MSTADKMQTVVDNVPLVYQAGRNDEWSDFWDSAQDFGNKVDYTRAFASPIWNAYTFRPKYDIRPTTAPVIFQNFGTEAIDLQAHLESCGVELDFSHCNSLNYGFNSAIISRVGIIDMRGVTTVTGADAVFHSCPSIVTIDKLIVNETYPMGVDSFIYCNNLKNITIEGRITGSFKINDSPLTVESMKSIINHLQDYSGTAKANTCTLSFKASCWTALEADGGAPVGETWKAYVNSLGWLTN